MPPGGSITAGVGREYGRPVTPGPSFVAAGQVGLLGASFVARGEPLVPSASIQAPHGTAVTIAVATRDGTPPRGSTVTPAGSVHRQTSQISSTLLLTRSSSREASTFKAPLNGDRDLSAEVGDLRRQLTQLKAAVDGDVLEAFRRLRQQQADLAARFERLMSGTMAGEVSLESSFAGASSAAAAATMAAAQTKTEALLQSLDTRVDAVSAETRSFAGVCSEDRRRVEELHAAVAQLQAQGCGGREGSWAALNAEDKEAGAKVAMARLDDRVASIDSQMSELRASQLQLAAAAGGRKVPCRDVPSPWADVLHDTSVSADSTAALQLPSAPGVAAQYTTAVEEERKLRELFDRCDADGLGLVSKAEMIQVLRGHPEVAHLFRPSRTTSSPPGKAHGGADVFETLFQQIDAEDDRCITWNALRGLFHPPGEEDCSPLGACAAGASF